MLLLLLPSSSSLLPLFCKPAEAWGGRQKDEARRQAKETAERQAREAEEAEPRLSSQPSLATQNGINPRPVP